jgi:hypothetical protein
MRRGLTRVGSVAAVLVGTAAATAGAQSRQGAIDLATILQRAGEKVAEYFVRAQSLVCIETVRLQPLGLGLAPDGFARVVESELRLSWDPLLDTVLPPEAKTLRQVLKVNGRQPRKDDHDNCTTPEQQSTETQPLSMLLPEQRRDYVFWLARPEKVDGRIVLVVDYRLTTPTTVEVSEVEGKDDCISYSVDGGVRGRIWLDPDTHEVLRLDQGLSGLVEVPMPRRIARRAGINDRFTLERMDTSIRFKPITFTDPNETLVLPVSSIQLRVTRGSGQPRLRTITDYVRYRRFLTGARVLPQ